MTTIALRHHHTAQPFNSAFFATMATVIPVLFLAVAVQGTAYEEMLGAIISAVRLSRQKRDKPSLVLAVAPVGVALILIFAVIGQITAVIALATRHGGAAEESITGAAVIILTLAAASGPASLLERTLRRPPPGQKPDRPDAQAPRENEPSAEPPAARVKPPSRPWGNPAKRNSVRGPGNGSQTDER